MLIIPLDGFLSLPLCMHTRKSAGKSQAVADRWQANTSEKKFQCPCTPHYFMLLDKVSPIMQYDDKPLWHHAINMTIIKIINEYNHYLLNLSPRSSEKHVAVENCA
jgi:hypothetical protein